MEPVIESMSNFVRERLKADFQDTRLAAIEFHVKLSGEVTCVCGGHEFPLPFDDAETACAYAAYMLQDDAIDELGRPWPELLDSDGKFVGVLVPPADAEGGGIAHWALREEPFCTIGHLHEAVAAAGLRIR